MSKNWLRNPNEEMIIPQHNYNQLYKLKSCDISKLEINLQNLNFEIDESEKGKETRWKTMVKYL